MWVKAERKAVDQRPVVCKSAILRIVGLERFGEFPFFFFLNF